MTKITTVQRRLLDDMAESYERGSRGMSCEQRRAIADSLYDLGLLDRYERGALMFYTITARGLKA